MFRFDLKISYRLYSLMEPKFIITLKCFTKIKFIYLCLANLTEFSYLTQCY